MDQKKIGSFIASLRKEHNMTQEDLASKLYIGREAVSKWERGVNIPDTDTLLNLSKVFGISINEILNGERITKDNKEKIEQTSLTIIKYKDKKIMHLKIFMLFVILISIGAYLMKSYYSNMNVYKIGFENNEYIVKGMVTSTFNSKHLYLENITCKEANVDILSVEIYENNELLLKDTDLSEKNNISIDEHFPNFNIEDLYIKIISSENETEKIKLDYIELHDNSNLFKNIFDSTNKSAFVKKMNEIDVASYARESQLPDNQFMDSDTEFVGESTDFKFITIDKYDKVTIRYYYNTENVEIINGNTYLYSFATEKCLSKYCDKELIELIRKEIYN